MADWVTHYFSIKSPSITAEELNRRFCSKDENGELNLDFNKIVPCEDNSKSHDKNWGFDRWYMEDENGFEFENGMFKIAVECDSTAQPIAKALSSILPDAEIQLHCFYDDSAIVSDTLYKKGEKLKCDVKFAEGEDALDHLEAADGDIKVVFSILRDAVFDNKATSVEIPAVEEITEIPECAFEGCDSLKEIIIPETITKICGGAFECILLEKIVIPASVMEIEGTPFYQCDSLESVVVAEGNKKYDSRNGCNAIIETATNKLVAGCKSTVIPKNVTEIGESAFEECTSLASVTIPDSVMEIGESAFSGCNSLTSITIPDSVTEIGEEAFEECYSLEKIKITGGENSRKAAEIIVEQNFWEDSEPEIVVAEK